MAAKKSETSPTGDALVLAILKACGITTKSANAEAPGLPTDTLFLEGEQTIEAYGKARPKFAKVPTINLMLTDAAKPLLAHAKESETAWSSVRFVKQKGENRALTRKSAETHRNNVVRTSRFLFRNDKKKLAEFERIAEGQGLADLIRDHEELAIIAGSNADVYAQAPKLGDIVEQSRAHAAALKTKRDDTEAQDLHQARNGAVVALELALAEIRAAARFLYDDNLAAMAPYLSTYPGTRRRKSK